MEISNQKSGDNSTNLQASGDIIVNNNTSVFYSIEELSRELLGSVFGELPEETKEKIRKKLQIIKYTNCKICKIEFSYRKRKNLTCGDKCLSDLKKLNNKKKRGLIIEEY